MPIQLHCARLSRTKAPLARGLDDSVSLANTEWQQKDRHKQQPLRELDPAMGFLQLARNT